MLAKCMKGVNRQYQTTACESTKINEKAMNN